MRHFIYKTHSFTKKKIRSVLRGYYSDFYKYSIIRSGGEVGELFRTGINVKLSGLGRAKFGNNVHIGSGSFIRAEGGLTIGNNVILSRNILLFTVSHNYEGMLLPFDSKNISKPVVIEDNVWIGMNAVICPGTIIREGAVIGMGTVVSGEVPPCSVVGSPKFRILKSRKISHYEKLKKERRFSRELGRPL